MMSIILLIRRIYRYHFKCNYLKNDRLSVVFITFLEFTLYFEHFQSKTSLIAWVFLKLLTLKDVVTWTHKRSSSWKPFDRDHVKIGFLTRWAVTMWVIGPSRRIEGAWTSFNCWGQIAHHRYCTLVVDILKTSDS